MQTPAKPAKTMVGSSWQVLRVVYVWVYIAIKLNHMFSASNRDVVREAWVCVVPLT